jgi:hypothetical protein
MNNTNWNSTATYVLMLSTQNVRKRFEVETEGWVNLFRDPTKAHTTIPHRQNRTVIDAHATKAHTDKYAHV